MTVKLFIFDGIPKGKRKKMQFWWGDSKKVCKSFVYLKIFYIFVPKF